MSTAEHPRRTATPPLVAGQRLDQATFHERYEAMPPGIRAELINGVVSMPSPAGLRTRPGPRPPAVLAEYYEENTPGVQVLDNATTFLGPRSEPQPDALLRILPECGGQTWPIRSTCAGSPSWSWRSPTRRGTPTSVRSSTTMSGRACSNTWCGRWSRTRCSGTSCRKADWWRCRRMPTACTDPASSRGSGSTRRALLTRDTRRLRAVIDQGVATAGARGVRRATGRGPRHPLIGSRDSLDPILNPAETLLDVL